MRGEKTITPKSQITDLLRKLWLRSVERRTALKRDKYTCVSCGRKQSKAKGQEFKVQVHHKAGVHNWDNIIEVIRKDLLCAPNELETLCKDCHDKKTYS